jgi:hypothetical protein
MVIAPDRAGQSFFLRPFRQKSRPMSKIEELTLQGVSFDKTSMLRTLIAVRCAQVGRGGAADAL